MQRDVVGKKQTRNSRSAPEKSRVLNEIINFESVSLDCQAFAYFILVSWLHCTFTSLHNIASPTNLEGTYDLMTWPKRLPSYSSLATFSSPFKSSSLAQQVQRARMDSNITTTTDEGGSGGTSITGEQARPHRAVRPLTIEDTEDEVEATAAEKVFALPELLETILIQVGGDLAGFKSLFVLQRVSTTFNDMINSSPKVKRIMFKQGTNKDTDTVAVLNPLFFDTNINRVFYPAILTDGKATFPTTVPDPASHGFKEAVHSSIGLKSEAIQSRGDLPTKPKGSWRKLKLCHSSEARGISARNRITGYGDAVRFDLNVHVTMGRYIDLNVFNPCWRKSRFLWK